MEYMAQKMDELIEASQYLEASIAQTAKDYDVDIEIALKIYRNHPNGFYKKLEEYIKERG